MQQPEAATKIQIVNLNVENKKGDLLATKVFSFVIICCKNSDLHFSTCRRCGYIPSLSAILPFRFEFTNLY